MSLTNSLVSKKDNLKRLKKVLHKPKDFKENIDYHNKACFSYNYILYGCWETWEDLIEMFNNLPPDENLFNELILTNSLVKPYLDIEWYDTECNMKAEDILNILLKGIKDVFEKEFDIEIIDEEIKISECNRITSKGYKYSYHIVINTTGPTFVFENNRDASIFAKLLRKYCKDIEYVIDVGVYKKTQNIRLVGQCKQFEQKPFRILNCNENELESNRLELDYIITHINPDYEIIKVNEQDDTLFSNIKQCDKISLETSSEKIEHIINVVKDVVYPSAELETIDEYGFLQFNYNHDEVSECFINNNNCHEQIGFFVYIYNGNIYMGCHSQNCNNEENGKKVIKIIGTLINENNNVNNNDFEKVSKNNDFSYIDHNFIKKCISERVLGLTKLFEKMFLEPKRIKSIAEDKNTDIYFWNGKIWQKDKISYIKRLLQESLVVVLKDFCNIYNKRDETTDIFTPEIEAILKSTYIHINKILDGQITNKIMENLMPSLYDHDFKNTINKHPYRLSCKNGIVDLKTGILRPAVPDDNITETLDLEYDEDVDYTDFDTFIVDITSTPDGPDKIIYNYLKWVLGYTIQGVPKEKKFFIFYGVHGYNGKSILVNIIKETLGRLYTGEMEDSVFKKGPKRTAGSHSADLIYLKNKRIGIKADLAEDTVIDDQLMKTFTSVSDSISARGLFKDQEEFKSEFVPIMCSNHPPGMNLSDHSFYERFIIISFLLSFVVDPNPKKKWQRKADKSLYEKLQKNKKGILKWLIHASLFYHNNPDIKIPERVLKEKELFRQMMDIQQDFIEKIFDITPVEDKSFVSVRDFLDAYKVYCAENKEKFVSRVAEEKFNKILKCGKINGIKVYYDLKFKGTLETCDSSSVSDELD